MSITILILIIVLGFIGTYAIGVGYIKTLRGEQTKRKTKDTDVMLMSLILGAPMMLILYAMCSDIRLEDKVHNYRFLIVGIMNTVVEILVIFLLFYFDVIIPLPTNPDGTSDSATASLIFNCLL